MDSGIHFPGAGHRAEEASMKPFRIPRWRFTSCVLMGRENPGRLLMG
jgi:hypothetical protein